MIWVEIDEKYQGIGFTTFIYRIASKFVIAKRIRFWRYSWLSSDPVSGIYALHVLFIT